MDLRRFSRNVLSLGVSTAVNVVVNLLLLPLVVHAVGRDLYGVYILVMTVTGYFALLDLGVDSSVIKFGAESLGRVLLIGVHARESVAEDQGGDRQEREDLRQHLQDDRSS